MKKIKKFLMFLLNIIVPGSDEAFDIFQNRAVPYLDLNKVRLGLDVADVAQLVADKIIWDPLFVRVSDPLLRTPASIEEKNTLRFVYEPLIRKVIGQAKKSNALTASDRSELNLPDPNEPRTRINPPTIIPVLTINAIRYLIHVLRIQDPENPDSHRKPAGVSYTEIYYFIGDAAPTDLNQYKLYGKTGRFLFTVQFGMADIGKTAWYIARYYNPRGEPGSWSMAVSATVA